MKYEDTVFAIKLGEVQNVYGSYLDYKNDCGTAFEYCRGDISSYHAFDTRKEAENILVIAKVKGLNHLGKEEFVNAEVVEFFITTQELSKNSWAKDS
jgi:hypothetical protein